MAAKPKQNAAVTREELEKQMQAFLDKGGKIEEVQSGISGVQPAKGTKHIVINPAK